METAKKILIDFSKPDEKESWRIVNDLVMGGVSQSKMIMTDDSTAIFQGNLSLENNGGFASVRTNPIDYRMAGYDGITARVKGDGRTYQLRLITDGRFDGVSYRSEFQTTADKWTNIKLPFEGFVPTFRGQVVPDAPELTPGKIRQLGFLIADKKEGSFRLEIDWIGAYMEREDEVDLDDYKWKNRLLMVFSPSESHPDYKSQKKEIVEKIAQIDERDLVVFEIFEEGENRVSNSTIAHAAGESLREKFSVKPEEHTVVLMGKDGAEKLRSTGHVPIEEIFSLIDSMPMRQSEIREREDAGKPD
ncbi:CIA30 family protein [Candidatus Poribacteria bacterium]